MKVAEAYLVQVGFVAAFLEYNLRSDRHQVVVAANGNIVVILADRGCVDGISLRHIVGRFGDAPHAVRGAVDVDHAVIANGDHLNRTYSEVEIRVFLGHAIVEDLHRSIAEDSGLILPIGAWVLREACGQARAWIDQGLPSTAMAVNVSAVQFRDEHFLEGIYAALRETGLDPAFLELELTESALMKQPELAVSILQNLRDKGVAVSVDDFGTGYSSLSYLKKLPLDILKIDQSFIHQLDDNPDDAAIAVAIISMGQSLNLRIIAEGVETAEDLAFLRAHGCDEVQGFYFSRPVPAEQFARLLNQTLCIPAGQVM